MTKPISTSRKPLNWEDYDYGRSSRNDSGTSLGSHVQFDEHSPVPSSRQYGSPHRTGLNNGPEQGDLHQLRHRRYLSVHSLACLPSETCYLLEEFADEISARSSLRSVTQAGGLNSLENFARSWSRAAGFAEIPTRKPSFVISQDEEANRRSEEAISPAETRSLLRQELEREGTPPVAVVDDEPASDREDAVKSANNVFDRAPYLSSSFASSNGGGMYGSLSSRVSQPAIHHSSRLYSEQQVAATREPDKETEPLVVRVIEQKDGRRVQVVVGQSTLPQTIFNSVNVLIGVGLLSLPLGLKYSGWLIGLVLLAFAAIVTRYTAGILARCLDVDASLIGFADIAWKAYGTKARIATMILFTFELVAACVALVVLFADSLDDLIPGFGIIPWKIFGGVVLIPLSFVPFRYLSVSSVLGIFSCLGSEFC